jgi:hypothetical protein
MAAIQRMPCACDGCINQLDLKNVGARYASSITCKYWDIFEGLNDWKIIKLVPGSENVEDDLDEAKQMVLHGIATETAEQIKIGEIGCFLTNDPESDGYYIVEWKSELYTLEEAIALVEYDPPLHLEEGELVCNGQYLNKVPGARHLYTPPSKPLPITVRLQQVLNPVLHMLAILQQNRLPSNCYKRACERLGARRISNISHDGLIEEIYWRECLKFEEEYKDKESEEELNEKSLPHSDDEHSQCSESSTGEL